jgi:hypothetical protein
LLTLSKEDVMVCWCPQAAGEPWQSAVLSFIPSVEGCSMVPVVGKREYGGRWCPIRNAVSRPVAGRVPGTPQ